MSNHKLKVTAVQITVKSSRKLVGCLRFRIKLMRAVVCSVVNLDFQNGYGFCG